MVDRESRVSEQERLHLKCPCGVLMSEEGEDALVATVQKHLEEVHPGKMYSKDQILAMAY